MTKILLIFVLIFIFALPLLAQDVDTAWVRRYNGPPGNSFDYTRAIAVDGSGNVYVTGYSEGSGTSYDYATIKYYPNGDTAWVRRYNGPGNGYAYDYASAIAVDGSGNVYVTGNSVGSGTGSDYTTIKYDPDGNELWVRRYNAVNSYDEAFAIAVDGSGNVYVTGRSYGSGTDYDYATIKYYPDGDTAWVRRYNGSGNSYDWARDIAVDGSGNVYVTGYSYGSGTSRDYATIKYDPNGNELWVRRYNGPGNSYDEAYAIAVDGSNNVYVTGGSYGSEYNSDYTTIKYYPNGDTAWVKRYNGPGSSDDMAYAITVDGSGNVYVTGESYGSWTGTDYATIKYDPDGNQLWVRRYNGPGNYIDYASAIAVDGSGNVYVTGRSYGSGTRYDYATIKYDPQGTQLWEKRYNGPGNSYDYAHAIAVDGSGNVYVIGESWGSGTAWDYATIKYWQNYPPNTFSLISPADSAIIPFAITFDWENSLDPELSDTVRYNLYISTSSMFHPDSTLSKDSLSISDYVDTMDVGRYFWKVKAYDRRSEMWSNQTWIFLSAIRGDANGDKQINVSDVVYLINYLFRGGPAPIPAPLVGDANCDGKATVSDVIYLINYFFKGGPPPNC